MDMLYISLQNPATTIGQLCLRLQAAAAPMQVQPCRGVTLAPVIYIYVCVYICIVYILVDVWMSECV